MDKYELDLEYKIVDLKDCQKSKGYYTCSDCKEFINCSLRNEYDKTFYKSIGVTLYRLASVLNSTRCSMSKDNEGDFNFD